MTFVSWTVGGRNESEFFCMLEWVADKLLIRRATLQNTITAFRNTHLDFVQLKHWATLGVESFYYRTTDDVEIWSILQMSRYSGGKHADPK